MVLDIYGLGPERSFNEITYAEFKEVHRLYSPLLPPADPYENLEDLRVKTIPETLRQRQVDGCIFLEKVELQILGEYRRKQHTGLIARAPCRTLAENSIDNVRKVTMEAFLVYGERRNYSQALEKLMKLRGVSLCMATLILSLHDPINIPYFSEGLYRWCKEEDARNGTWNRQLDYHLRQYKELLGRVAQLRGRMKADSGTDVTALEVEQVARQLTEWALHRRKKRPRAQDDDYLLKPLDKREEVSFDTAPSPQQAVRDTASSTPGGAQSAQSPPSRSPSTPSGGADFRPLMARTLIACDSCRRAKRRCNHDVPPRVFGARGRGPRPRQNAPPVTQNGRAPSSGNPQLESASPQTASGASPSAPYPPGSRAGQTSYQPPPVAAQGPTPYPPPALVPVQIPYLPPGSMPPHQAYPSNSQMSGQAGSFSQASLTPTQQPGRYPANMQQSPQSSPISAHRSSAFPLPDPHAAIREALVAWQSKQ